MIKEYQVTLFSKAYKPVSCIVKKEQYADEDYSRNPRFKKELQKMGVKKICEKHRWQLSDLMKYEYTTYKVRPYKPE